MAPLLPRTRTCTSTHRILTRSRLSLHSSAVQVQKPWRGVEEPVPYGGKSNGSAESHLPIFTASESTEFQQLMADGAASDGAGGGGCTTDSAESLVGSYAGSSSSSVLPTSFSASSSSSSSSSISSSTTPHASTTVNNGTWKDYFGLSSDSPDFRRRGQVWTRIQNASMAA